MTEALPGGGTDQHSAASQAAAVSASAGMAASRPEAAALYEAAPQAPQQQASLPEPAEHAPEEESPAAVPPKAEDTEEDSAAPDSELGDSALEDSSGQGAPEHYAFKAVPGVHFSDEVLGSFSEAAKALNLPQDAAQHMLDRVAPAIARQQQAAIHALNEQWVSQVKADKEIGGERLQQNLAIAKKARDAFGSEGLRRLLNESRIGNHPEMIRFFVRAGQAISEDAFIPGGARPPAGGKDAATVLYGKTTN